MAKILRQNVGGVDFTMAGCALTGVCPTSAADYIKQITLSDGDVIEDGMMMVVTFANGNSAGNAPGTKTIYSSDQVNYFEDEQLTVPFTLAPEGCYEIEYTGTANAYTYTDYPVFQVGSVTGPVCDYRGHITSGDLWNAGDSVQCMLKGGKFLLLGGSGGTEIDVYDSMQDVIDDLPNLQDKQIVATKDTGDELAQPVDVVEADNMHAVTSNAVAEYLNNQNLLSDYENYSLSTTNATMDYDGVLIWTVGGGTGGRQLYINDVAILGVTIPSGASGLYEVVTVNFRKGDKIRLDYGMWGTAKIAYYKLRDYSLRQANT